MLEVLLRTPASSAIEDLLFRGEETLHVPEVFDLEVVQVLRRWSIHGTLSIERASQALADLEDFPIIRHSHGPLINRIWQFRSNLTAYDAAYLALTEALGATLVTRDHALARYSANLVRIESF